MHDVHAVMLRDVECLDIPLCWDSILLDLRAKLLILGSTPFSWTTLGGRSLFDQELRGHQASKATPLLSALRIGQPQSQS
jgi:hypothetical protein